MDKYDSLEMQNPVLMVGIGGVGAKLAVASNSNLECNCLLISNDKRDLDVNKYDSVFIDSQPWLNPSSHKIRSLGILSETKIRSCLDAHSTISKMTKEDASRKVISFAIMPFRFEKDRIFQAGVSLRRLRESSDATVVIDNDALLNNNPSLSIQECYDITNNALHEVISSISSAHIQNSTSLLCTGRPDGKSAEAHVKDCLAMLYENSDTSAIRTATLYLMGGTALSVGTVNSIANTLREMFKQQEIIDVSIVMPNSQSLKVHLLAAVQEKTRFDNYDPLAEVIPRENILDWEEMESSPNIEITIPNLE